MSYPIYPQSAHHRFAVQGFAAHRNRRRGRWPVIALWFILGLLVGWVLRGGGAGLP